MSNSIVFKVDMSELKRKINFVRNGLGSSRTDLPVMLMRFDVTGNKAVVFAAEHEVFCRTEMKISRLAEDESPKDGTFALLGGKLEKLCAQSESEEVLFKADADNLEVQSGFLTLNWELYDGSPLKDVANGVSEHLTMEGMSVPKDALEESLGCGKACSTTSAVNPNYNHVELRNGHLLSSDGRKVMMYSHDGFAKDLKFKAPNTALNSLISSVKNIDTQSVQIIEGKSYFYVKGGLNEYSVGVRKVERSFPPLEDHVTESLKVDEKAGIGPTDEITMDKHVLNAIVSGVQLGLPNDEIKINVEIAGAGTDAYLEVSAMNALGKRSHERASCTRKAADRVNFPVSFLHLQSTLGVFKGDSVVDIAILKNKNMMVVKDHTDTRQVVTIIPFRTEKEVEKEKKEAADAAAARKKEKEGSEVKTEPVTAEVEEAVEL